MFRFRSRPADSTLEQLDVCLRCGRDLVHPVRWHEADQHHWWVELRCGECGTSRRGCFADETLERFDRRLDTRQHEIELEADRLHESWRSDEADAFAAALERGLIEANDFDDRAPWR